LISLKKCCVFSTGLAVEGYQSGSVFFPAVAELAQHVGGVVVAGRGLYPQRVKFLRFLESLCNFGKARDDAAAVAVDADGTAFPVALASFV
jgi:hypothetical protein